MIVETIEAVVGTLSQPVHFLYADLYESNLLDQDRIPEGKDIFFVYVPPFEANDVIATNRAIHTSFPLQFFIVKRLTLPTTDYKSYEVQPVVDEMRELAREFINKLNHQAIVEKSTEFGQGITGVKYLSEYAWQDYHLFGVSGQATVPIYEGKTAC
jgi:hypothetical protein